MSDRHPIPEATTEGLELGEVVLKSEAYFVAEWCPTPDASGPPTQVHVVHRIAGVVRFKSAGELDRFIAVLARHRLNVWPEKEGPT